MGTTTSPASRILPAASLRACRPNTAYAVFSSSSYSLTGHGESRGLVALARLFFVLCSSSSSSHSFRLHGLGGQTARSRCGGRLPHSAASVSSMAGLWPGQCGCTSDLSPAGRRRAGRPPPALGRPSSTPRTEGCASSARALGPRKRNSGISAR